MSMGHTYKFFSYSVPNTAPYIPWLSLTTYMHFLTPSPLHPIPYTTLPFGNHQNVLHIHDSVYSFFYFYFYFIFREKGREGERKGQKHQCVVVSNAPYTGDLACNPGMCPDWESNRRSFCSQANAQSTKPHQAGLYSSYLLSLFSYSIFHRYVYCHFIVHSFDLLFPK